VARCLRVDGRIFGFANFVGDRLGEGFALPQTPTQSICDQMEIGASEMVEVMGL